MGSGAVAGTGAVRVFPRFMLHACVFSLQLEEAKSEDTKVDESQVWVPAEEPVINSAFLFDSKIWEVCQELPVHWIHPAPLSGEGRGTAASISTPDAGAFPQALQRFL